VSELQVVYLFLALLGLFIVIGALIPKYLSSLVRYVDDTVLKENRKEHH